MASTRDDRAEISCRLNQYNNSMGYMLNVPGNGTHPDYIVDPQIRLQTFGANLSANVVDINSKLLGVYNQLSRDCYVPNTRDPNFNPEFKKMTFPSITNAITDQPRTTMPAWELRGVDRNNWDFPLRNEQEHIEMHFINNVDSRQNGKDAFRSTCGM
jgi:hypothetical protein